jgi:hypothetical protein
MSVVSRAVLRATLLSVERTAWSDQRLNHLASRMDAGFERVDADIRELRSDIAGLRTEVRSEIGGLRTELGGQIDMLRITLLRVGGGVIVGLVGVIAAVLAAGG